MGTCRPRSDSEADAMEAHCQGPEERALLVLLRKTGYRSHDVASLTVGDLWDGHQVKDRVQVRRAHMKKQVARRAIPMGAELKRTLLCWLMQLQQAGFLKPATPLWLSRKHVTTRPGWTRETIWRKVNAIADRAGIQGHIGCHSYRKLFCIRIYQASDRDMMKTKEAMGHRQVGSTQVYLESILNDADIDALILRAA